MSRIIATRLTSVGFWIIAASLRWPETEKAGFYGAALAGLNLPRGVRMLTVPLDPLEW